MKLGDTRIDNNICDNFAICKMSDEEDFQESIVSEAGMERIEMIAVKIDSERDLGESRPTESRRRRKFAELTLRRPTQHRIYALHSRNLPSRNLGKEHLKEKLDKIAAVLPYATVRIAVTPSLNREEQATAIANCIEHDKKLMQDDPLSELKRIETLKKIPECLTLKRSVRTKLTMSVSQRSKKRPISNWIRFRYALSMAFAKTSIKIREVASTMEFWYNDIKSVEGHFGSGVAAYFKFLRWLFMLNIFSCILSISFVAVPQSLITTYKDSEISGWDFITGNGFFTNSVMYYGFYSNETIQLRSDIIYAIPSAYFMTFFVCYALIFILLSMKVAKSYRKCFIETSAGLRNVYATKIFCGWDFSISSSKAAEIQSATICCELRELLAEYEKKPQPDCLTKFVIRILQISITLLVLMIMSATGMLLWLLLSLYKPELDSSSELSLMVMPFIITIILNIFPAFISWLVKFEKYNDKRIALYVTMIRIYGMAVIIIGTLVAFWLTKGTTGCWQTHLAQEIYRLILLDFVITILGSFISETIRLQVLKRFEIDIDVPVFDIARNTLNLIYNQTLFWLVFYFSPPISVLILVKMMLTFYIKKYGLFKNCEPPMKSWRAAQTQTVFLALSFFGIICVLVTFGYIFSKIESHECGPFKGHQYTWEFVVDHIFLLDRESAFWNVVTQLTTPVTGAVIIVSMCIGVYCLRAKVKANKKMVEMLRAMLTLQAKDKEFLLRSFTRVTDEDWVNNEEFGDTLESDQETLTSSQSKES